MRTRLSDDNVKKEQTTHIVILRDRSGSMWEVKGDVDGALAAFLSEQKAVPGKATITLADFNSAYETVYSAENIQDAEVSPLEPAGCTALLDAVGRGIRDTDSYLSGLGDSGKPDLVIVVIITDGMENASREYTRTGVKNLIEARTKESGWRFSFLAAGVDAFSEANSLGISKGNTMQYKNDPDGVRQVYCCASQSITSLRTGAIGVKDDMFPDTDEYDEGGRS